MSSDIEALYRWRTLDEIVWWTGAYVWPESLAQAQTFVEDQMNDTDKANRKFVICCREDDKYLGHIGYEYLDLRRQNAELGIVIGEMNLLSKGLGGEAIRLFLKVCFQELNLHRVGLRVIRENKRGFRCYQKCGFREEGILREWHFSRGKWHDLVLMGILKKEYQAGLLI